MTILKKEIREIIRGFNETDAPFPQNETLHGLFEKQVKKTPGNIAVMFKEDTLTYEEFNGKADALARLLRQKGIGREGIVGVMVERSLEMMIALMAILKAGGAYLPISPSTPAKRLEYFLNDTHASVLLVQDKLFKTLNTQQRDNQDFNREVEIINLDDIKNFDELAGPIENINTADDLAYIIYTSGSTGRPKGVMIEHRSIINRLNWMQKCYRLDEHDTLLQKTPYFFDVSVWELFWWSITGARVCFLVPGVEKFPQFLVETVEKAKVTVMHFVPSMLSPFLQYLQDDEHVIKRLGSLRQVFTSGESLLPAHVRSFNETLFRVNQTRLANLYGPTEATVDVTYFDILPGENLERVPIGRPIDNIQIHILDAEMEQVPVGVEGEICISGTGVARGYLNKPGMTREKFVMMDDGTVSRCLYKTGDQGRWIDDGNIEYLGRRDQQVKIRGLRIELGEIEAAISSIPGVMNCVVVVRQFNNSIILILGYIVLKEGIEMGEKNIKNVLKGLLPDYMVPNQLIIMDSFPLTANGKIDRELLPEPTFFK